MFDSFNHNVSLHQVHIMKTHNYSFKCSAESQEQDLEGNRIQILNEFEKTDYFIICSIYFY